MDADRLMQAMLQSFLDADMQVELVPRLDHKGQGRTASTSTGPSYDATTQASARHTATHKQSEPVRGNYSNLRADSTAQAVDGQYASVYRVQHCKMTPTSPTPMPSEFPPQRADVSYGCDNFQVGGMGSGETYGAPIKTTSYRGAGLNWPSRAEVFTPRVSRCSNPFERSLRHYPPAMSPDRSPELLERTITYAMPRTYRSPRHSPLRSPQRDPGSRKHDDYRPRAPEEDPTRDRREEFSNFSRQASKRAAAKQEDIRNIREMSRRLRKSLKSISSYTHTHTLSTFMDAMDHECDRPILETSETEHEDQGSCRYPVNTPVQAVVPTTSLGVEAKLLSTSQRTIAVPITPISSRLTTRGHDLPSPLVTKSIQTFNFSGRSVETVTSTTELPINEPVKLIVKKSKSVSDFRLNRNFKSEIIAWLDDNSDPKIDEIKQVVLNDLSSSLKGLGTAGAEKLKVKIGNCLKSCGKSNLKKPLRYEFHKREICNSTQSHNVLETKAAKQNEFKDVKAWLNNISINNRDIISRPMEKDKILDTLIKNIENEKSTLCNEQTMRESILKILGKLLLNVNVCDKAAFLRHFADDLMCKLDTCLLGDSQSKPSPFNNTDNCNTNESLVEDTEQATKEIVETEMKEVSNPDLRRTIIDLVDMLKDSINNNFGSEEIASTSHETTEKAKSCGMHYKKIATNFRTQPVTVFMVQNFSRNFNKKPSVSNMSQASIRSIADKDIEANLNRYKTQLARQIDQWLLDLAVLRSKGTDFRRAVVLDLASDIVDRQKYLQFNTNIITDIDEIEHLKYLIFKWIKRYVSEENMETVNHAVELMEMIRNIPVPELNKSQDFTNKCKICKKDYFESSPSTGHGKDNVYISKSDSGIQNRGESQSDSAPLRTVNIVSNKPNLGRSVSNNSVCSKCNKTFKNDPNLKRKSSKIQNSFVSNNIGTKNVVRNIRQSNNINKEEHSSQDSFVSTRSRDNLQDAYSNTRCKHCSNEPGPTTDMSKDNTNKPKSNTCICYIQNSNKKNLRFTNFLFHKSIPSNQYDRRNKKQNKSKQDTVRNSSKTSIDSDKCGADCSKPDLNVPEAGQLIVTPEPSQPKKPSSAAAQLMAEWQPPPVFTPPPPGRPLRDQVYDEFKEYLKNWCQQIPIPSSTSEEIEAATNYRSAIINGVWKMITKLKTQPAVFQNKFYYEDVLGKEIDGLLDCLPRTQELQEKRYPLKAQLLEKISDMNDLVKEIEMPDNYKEMIAQREKLIKDKFERGIIRQTCRTDREDPKKFMEEMFKYCTLEDFLKLIDYQEPNLFLATAYKNRLLKRIQEYINEAKAAHGKEVDELCDFWKECDINEELKKVPLPAKYVPKEEAEEVFLGIEIEQWMSDLPIVKNNDEKEQRQRVRLRDKLVKNIKEMEKEIDISDCCGDTQVRHEISQFLEIVPLERDQDLKINEMVEDLTNRLKNRLRTDSVGGKRKSVVFQGFDPPASSSPSERMVGELHGNPPNTPLLNDKPPSAPLLCDDSLSDPLCSTKIGNPIERENEDEQFRGFRDGAPMSPIIGPRGGFQLPPSNMSAKFRHSMDRTPHFDWPPEQLQESAQRGSLGHSRRGSHEESYHYPGVVGSPLPAAPISDSKYVSLLNVTPADHKSIPTVVDHQGTPRGRESTRNDDLFVSIPEDSGPRSRPQMPPAPRMSDAPCSPHRTQIHPNMSQQRAERSSQAPPMTSYRSPQQPGEAPQASFQSVRYKTLLESQPYIEPQQQQMSYHSSRNQPILDAPTYYSSRNVPIIEPQQQQTSYHSPCKVPIIEPQPYKEPQQQQTSYHSPRNQPIFEAPSCHSSRNVPIIEPQSYIVPQQQRTSYHSPRNITIIEPQQQQTSYHSPCNVPIIEQQPYMEPQQRQPTSYHSPRNQPFIGPQPYPEPQPSVDPQLPCCPPDQPLYSRGQRSQLRSDPSNATSYSRNIPEPLEVSVQVHAPRSRLGNQGFVSAVSQQQPIEAPLETSQNLRPNANTGQPSIRITPIEAQERIQEVAENVHRSITQPQGPVPSRQTTRNQGSREPSQRQGPHSGFTNQPDFYSTPNRVANPPPPPYNMRERRQQERDRANRRIDMDADEDGEDRCHCRARFRQWSARPNCHTCDSCMHGQFYPYPYPYLPPQQQSQPHPPPPMFQPYMFPPFGRPPHPPHCRR